MRHTTTKRFWKQYYKQTSYVQNLADKAFNTLRENPSHHSLQFKKVGELYSVRIGLSHKALSIKDEECYIWVWIGSHDEYERLLSNK